MPAQSKVIPLEGEIDLHISPRITTTLNAAVKAKPRNLVIDMGNVSYIDSSGLGELVTSFTTVRNQNGELKLLNLTRRVQDLLQITKLLTVFESFNSEAEALKSLK